MTRRPRQSIEAQMAEMGRILAEYAPRLRALMPPGVEIAGDPEGQMHLSMSDFNSCEAARVTLEKFGQGVDCYNGCVDPTQWFIRFADDDVGDQAIRFYNGLPQNMRRYVPKGG